MYENAQQDEILENIRRERDAIRCKERVFDEKF